MIKVGIIQYNPIKRTWTTKGGLKTARDSHTATLLASGEILVTGGEDSFSIPLKSSELYHQAKGVWTYTGSLNSARCGHTATLLQDGTVLVAGGYNISGVGALYALGSAEIYQPAAGN